MDLRKTVKHCLDGFADGSLDGFDIVQTLGHAYEADSPDEQQDQFTVILEYPDGLSHYVTSLEATSALEAVDQAMAECEFANDRAVRAEEMTHLFTFAGDVQLVGDGDWFEEEEGT